MFNILNIPGYPCTKDCSERCVGCKSTCKRYLKILPKIKKVQEEYRKEIYEKNDYIGFKINCMENKK